MMARHVVFLVEDLSTEAFLRALLPRLIPADRSFEIHAFQGKPDLLAKLAARLRAYARWLPQDWRLVVLVDRDEEDCLELKKHLESTAAAAGLVTRSRAGAQPWQLVNRIAIEELEAWYFGNWSAVRVAYPRLPSDVPQKEGFRNPDAIVGGTWEAFERVIRQRGYFTTGLRKVEAARVIGAVVDPTHNRSASFRAFTSAVTEACA